MDRGSFVLHHEGVFAASLSDPVAFAGRFPASVGLERRWRLEVFGDNGLGKQGSLTLSARHRRHSCRDEYRDGTVHAAWLSPLLSNIVLDELDQELARRGHRFVRYADDAKVYVRSERAGQRVMVSLTAFIEGRLRLKVNEAKSAVARPEDRHFLGFRLRLDPQTGIVEVLLSERTKRNAMARVRQLTPRNWGRSLADCIARINAWLGGWHGFFGIASVEEMQMMRKIDAHIRRRLRAIILRYWKRKRTISKRLVALGVNPRAVWHQIYQGRRSWWALSHCHAVDQGLRNAYSAKRGLVSVVGLHRRAHQHIAAPVSPQLALWG